MNSALSIPLNPQRSTVGPLCDSAVESMSGRINTEGN